MTKILVIEDEEAIRENIIETLELNDYDVVGAPDGSAGVSMAHEIKPDLILCDIMMGDLDGYRVLEHIRRTHDIALTPFVFLTAKADRFSMRYGMELGADDYLTKPFTTGELLTAVQTRIQRHKEIINQTDEAFQITKKQLAHVVAHELRTPLTSMNMAVQLLSYQVDSIPPDELQELIQTLASGTNRMNRLVEQMVMFTQLQTNLLSQEVVEKYARPVEVWTLLMTCSNYARLLLAGTHGVQVIIDDRDTQSMVLADNNSLRHALGELFANAIAYSPDGTQVKVTQWQSDGWVWITIVDEGIGMTQADIDDALSDFTQIDRETREQQGLGLGLPLAKKIIEIHGGSIEIHSVPNKGTQVQVALPAFMGYEES